MITFGIILIIVLVLVMVCSILLKMTGLIFKLLYVCIIGLPLAVLCIAVGLVFCVTLIGIPLGKGMFRLAGEILMPF